jgi:hypothetical protein
VLWLVATGWAAQVATTRRQRLLLSVVVVAVLPGFMNDHVREATIAAGLLLLVWVPVVLVPRVLVPGLAALASASLYIYLTHFEVYRSTDVPWVNFALGIGVGLVAWFVATRIGSRFGSRLRALRTAPREPASRPAHPPAQEVPR